MSQQPEQMGPMEALLVRMAELQEYAANTEDGEPIKECVTDLLALVALLIQDHNDLLDLMDSFIQAKQKADAAPKLVVAGTGDLQAIRQGRL